MTRGSKGLEEERVKWRGQPAARALSLQQARPACRGEGAGAEGRRPGPLTAGHPGQGQPREQRPHPVAFPTLRESVDAIHIPGHFPTRSVLQQYRPKSPVRTTSVAAVRCNGLAGPPAWTRERGRVPCSGNMCGSLSAGPAQGWVFSDGEQLGLTSCS